MEWCWDFSWGGFHGMALWVAHGNPPMAIPCDAIGISHVEFNGMLLWVAHEAPPMGIPWNAIVTSHLVDTM